MSAKHRTHSLSIALFTALAWVGCLSNDGASGPSGSGGAGDPSGGGGAGTGGGGAGTGGGACPAEDQCDDGNPCTTNDCRRAGVCEGVPVVCDTPPAPACDEKGPGIGDDVRITYAATGTCDAASGACVYEPETQSCPGCAEGCPAHTPAFTNFVHRNTAWKYLDDGSDQGTGWTAIDFDDGGWAEGDAKLGYGDGDEATVVDYGSDASNKHVTTYFRRSFAVDEPSDFVSLHLELLVDDGAVVHINGVEVHRANVPAGAVDAATFAAGSVDASAYLLADLDPSVLRAGKNVVAVEVHQASAGSSDLAFNLRLYGKTANDPTFTTFWSHEDWAALGLTKEFLATAYTGTASHIDMDSSGQVRSPGSSSARYVYDPETTRAELHSARNYLGVQEGSVVYFGWSDFYVTAPIHEYTVFQWRNEDKGYTGCPDIQFEMVGDHPSLGTVNGIYARVKAGKSPGSVGVLLPNLAQGVWYDFVVGMKYAKDDTGFFDAWAGPAGTLDYASPAFTYQGPTMYSAADIGTPDAPCSYNGGTEDHFHEVQLRMGGAYMWGTQAPFESYKGPLRIHLGEMGEPAFARVLPR